MLTFVSYQRMGVLSSCDSFQIDVAVLQIWFICSTLSPPSGQVYAISLQKKKERKKTLL